jgi:hypothetical protein
MAEIVGFADPFSAPSHPPFGANYTHLTEVKAKYDPDNLFRVNQNVPPSRAALPS